MEENLSHHSLQICVCQLKPYCIIYKPVSQSTAIIFPNPQQLSSFLSFFYTSPTHHALNNVHLPFTTAPEKRDHQVLPPKELVQYVFHSLSFFFFINFSRIDNCLYSWMLVYNNRLFLSIFSPSLLAITKFSFISLNHLPFFNKHIQSLLGKLTWSLRCFNMSKNKLPSVEFSGVPLKKTHWPSPVTRHLFCASSWL